MLNLVLVVCQNIFTKLFSSSNPRWLQATRAL